MRIKNGVTLIGILGAGQYFFLPGGDRHVSGGDAKEGVLFYEESMGKFDLNAVK